MSENPGSKEKITLICHKMFTVIEKNIGEKDVGIGKEEFFKKNLN